MMVRSLDLIGQQKRQQQGKEKPGNMQDETVAKSGFRSGLVIDKGQFHTKLQRWLLVTLWVWVTIREGYGSSDTTGRTCTEADDSLEFVEGPTDQNGVLRHPTLTH